MKPIDFLMIIWNYDFMYTKKRKTRITHTPETDKTYD